MAWFGIRTGLHQYLPGLTRLSDSVVERTLKRVTKTARLADVGAGGRRISRGVITVDRFTEKNIDLVADVHELPFSDNCLDAVFCTGTLEHVESPKAVITEIHRILKHGGIAHIEVPFLQPFHADPNDYWRWTLPGLELFLTRNGFAKIEAGVHIGPASALNWVFNEFVLTLLGHGKIGTFFAYTLRFLCYPLLFLDFRLVQSGRSINAACGIYFIGQKNRDNQLA